MNAGPWAQLVLYLVVLFVLAWPLGRWLNVVFDGRMAARWVWMRAAEHGLLRIVSRNRDEDMS